MTRMSSPGGGSAEARREAPPAAGEPEAFFDEGAEFRFSDYGIEDYVVLVVFWVLALVVFAQFFSRYVLNDSIAWTEEVARYLLIMVGFLGAAIAVRNNTHVHVEFFYRYLGRRAGRVLSTVVDLLRIAFFGYATVLSWKIMGIMHNQRMTALDLPMSVIYAVVLVGFAAMTLRAVQVAWRHYRQGYSALDEKIQTRATT